MRIKQNLILLVGLFVSFFLDGQLTFLLSGLTGFQLSLASHLLLLVIFYGSFESGSLFFYGVLFLVGLFYDSHYLMTVGLVTLLLPMLFALLRFFGPFLRRGRLQRILSFLCLIVFFEVLLYRLARLVGLTSYPLMSFITAQLLPTSLFNLFYMIIFSRGLDQFFGLRQITKEL